METQKCNLKQHPEIGVIMVPLPGQSHLNLLLHLSQIISSYEIPVHFVGSETHNLQAKIRLQGSDPQNLSKIQFHDFQLPPLITTTTTTSPSPTLSHCVPFPPHYYPLFKATTQLQDPIFKLLQKLSLIYRRIIIIHDIVIASVVQDVKSIPNAETYSVIPISCFTLFLDLWENMDEKPFQIDPNDIPSYIPSKEGCTPPEIDEFVAYQFGFLGLESGRIYNTSREIEPRYVELMEKLSPRIDMKHFVLGPLNPVNIERKTDEERHPCLKWLDEQEQGSVIYVSFGSTTTLSSDQIRELAIGLEKSEQKFIWVLRDCDTVEIHSESEVSRSKLPQGFENRVKSRGIVVRDWAPQLDILAHSSIDGFMSHCGWNSCIESVSMGVAMAAWPMHSDQPRNAVLVTDVLKIGVLVREWESRAELVMANTIENVVRRLMGTQEGKEMRKRAAELGVAVRRSVGKSGSAQLEMESFITHITR